MINFLKRIFQKQKMKELQEDEQRALHYLKEHREGKRKLHPIEVETFEKLEKL